VTGCICKYPFPKSINKRDPERIKKRLHETRFPALGLRKTASMPNLFFALRNSKPETLAMQLALLKNVSTSNALLPFGQKSLKWGASAINRAGSFFNKGDLIEEPSVVELKDRVRASFVAYKSDSVDQLLSDGEQIVAANRSHMTIRPVVSMGQRNTPFK
jgi:hypothetical protein